MSTSKPAAHHPPGPTVRRGDPDSAVVSLVGSGGEGAALFGELILSMAARQGLYGVMVQSYGPQIRGGESASLVRVSRREVCHEGEETDLLICFRTPDMGRFRGFIRLHEGSVVTLDSKDTGDLPEWVGTAGVHTYRFPFTNIVDGHEVAGDPKNMLALGLACRYLGWDADLGRHELRQRFGNRPALLSKDLDAFDRGYGSQDMPTMPHLQGSGRNLHIETGNEAVARGAMQAGLRFFAGYPITPSSEILETLIDELPGHGGSVVQAEDEISALGMVLGASFGGVKAMTATSGPGLSLMTEMMGLSAKSEIPAVIVDCQRAGPATGMPSRTEQSDLNHALYSGHGDLPRVVMGVMDVVHARDIMHKAFSISEGYQVPVLVLSDAYIAQRHQIRDEVPPPPAQVNRSVWREDGPTRFNLDTADGVVPFRVPGTPGGQYLAAGIEQTPAGTPSADTTIHALMGEKRWRKMDAIAEHTESWFRVLGKPGATRGIIAWGSNYGLLCEWVKAHPEYRAFVPEILMPFPIKGLEEWRKGLGWTGALELAHTGQFYKYLKTLTDVEGTRSLKRSGGLPLSMVDLDRLIRQAD